MAARKRIARVAHDNKKQDLQRHYDRMVPDYDGYRSREIPGFR